jgi:hypothetical protein
MVRNFFESSTKSGLISGLKRKVSNQHLLCVLLSGPASFEASSLLDVFYRHIHINNFDLRARNGWRVCSDFIGQKLTHMFCKIKLD